MILKYLFGHVSRAIDANKRGRRCELSNNTCSPDRPPAAKVCEPWSAEYFTERYFRSKHPQWDHHTEEPEEVSEQNDSFEHRKSLGQECVESGSEECDGDGLIGVNVSGQ